MTIGMNWSPEHRSDNAALPSFFMVSSLHNPWCDITRLSAGQSRRFSGFSLRLPVELGLIHWASTACTEAQYPKIWDMGWCLLPTTAGWARSVALRPRDSRTVAHWDVSATKNV